MTRNAASIGLTSTATGETIAKPDVDAWAAAACLDFVLTGKFPRDFKPHQDVWQTVISTDALPIRNRDFSIPDGWPR